MKTVNILIHRMVVFTNILSFEDSRNGNNQAKKKFSELCLDIDNTLTKENIDEYIEDGVAIFKDGTRISLMESD